MNNNYNLENLLHTLFAYFESHKIRYCVIRNYELFPIENIGNDVDILIEKKVFLRKLDNFEKLLLANGYMIKVTSSRQYVIKTIISSIKNQFTLEVDFITDLAWKGCRFMSVKATLQNASLLNTFYIPSPSDECAMSLLHSLLFGGFVKEKYRLKLTNFIDSGADLNNSLRPYFADSDIDFISKALHDKNYKSIEDFCNKLRLNIIIRNLRFNPMKTLYRFFEYFFSELSIRLFQ